MESTDSLIRHAMDRVPVAVTIIDGEGTLLFYNREAARILDRKPDYIGVDFRTHHRDPSTNEKINGMMSEFGRGRTEPFRYEASPYGKTILVTFSPIHVEGQFVGCVQLVKIR